MSEKIKVLLVEPMKKPVVTEMENTLSAYRQAVGGDMEAVYPFEDRVALVCNEEGKLNGMELNRALRDESGEIYDVVAGPFLIVGLSESDFGSLDEKLLRKYEQQYRVPEQFVQIGGKIHAIPVPARRDNDRGEREER